MQETVADLMSPTADYVRDSATVADTALRMLEEHVRELPVVDAEGNLAGVVRAEDLFSVTGPTIDSAIKPCRLVLPHDVSSTEAVRMMHKTGARHTAIVDGKRLIGWIRWEDVVRDLSD